jgi:hypothetical protein
MKTNTLAGLLCLAVLLASRATVASERNRRQPEAAPACRRNDRQLTAMATRLGELQNRLANVENASTRAPMPQQAPAEFNANDVPAARPKPAPEAGLFAALAPEGDFGGFALVGQESGLAVAGGGIVWSGVANYWIPTAWNDPGDLSCGRESVEPTETYLDPRTCVSGALLDTPATASEALDVVLRSNLAAQVASEGPFSAYTFLHTRTEGECSPKNVEYLVVLTRGL